MGGDHNTTTSTPDEDHCSSVDQDFVQSSSSLNYPSHHLRNELFSGKMVNEDFGMLFGEFEEMGSGGGGGGGKISPTSLEFEANQMKRCKAFKEVLQSYDQLRSRADRLNEAKSIILSYTPGGLMEKAGGMKLSDYNVPKTTTLLLVGPKGSGKSSLVNRISKVFEDDKFAPDRAQVSYNSSAAEGTYFLQEYMIPRDSNSFCLYDTRSLLDDPIDNVKVLKDWMTKGVRHGELIIRPSDDSSLRTRMNSKTHKNGRQSKETRMVNFVIFVVNGLAMLKSMVSDVEKENEYAQNVATTFSCPYLSFRDYKPVVVVTHGDLLSLSDRVRVRVLLGELLGIPPAKQIFDIPESCDPVAEMTIIDMLRYSLEHAEKNFPPKYWLAEKVHSIRGFLSDFLVHRVGGSLSAFVLFFVVLWIATTSINIHKVDIRRAMEPEVRIDWHTIRHLWLG